MMMLHSMKNKVQSATCISVCVCNFIFLRCSTYVIELISKHGKKKEVDTNKNHYKNVQAVNRFATWMQNASFFLYLYEKERQ